jgi:hypothetical protein
MRPLIVITLFHALAFTAVAHAQVAGTAQRPAEPTSGYYPNRPEPVSPAAYDGAYDAMQRSRASVLPTQNGSTSDRAVLVVPSQDMPAETRSELATDLDVMCAVLDRLLGDAGLKTRSWGPHVNRYRRSARSLYLPGFGAIFLVEVDFPLAPPEQNDQPTDVQTTDAVWEEVRTGMRSQTTRGRRRTTSTQAQYDELKVQSLTRTLQRAMRHCANVRHIRPEENIIALAIDAPQSRSPVIYGNQGNNYSAYYRPLLGAGGAQAHVLAIQANRKDIAALADGDLSAADFHGRLRTLSYELPALQPEPAPRSR